MLEAVEGLAVETVKAASVRLWPLSDREVTRGLEVVHRWEQSVAVLKARLVGEVVARGVPLAEGHRSVAGWLRERLRLDPFAARELVGQAGVLGRRPVLEQALLDGALDMRQAMVIAAAVDAIPGALSEVADGRDPGEVAAGRDPGGASADPVDGSSDGRAGTPDVGSCGIPDAGFSDTGFSDVGTSAAGTSDPGAGAGVPDVGRIVRDAEAVLIGMAGRFPAYQLRPLGERIMAHVAPEVADRADEAALRRQEQRAHAKRSFTLSLPVGGMVRLSGVLDVEAAAIVQAALQPLCVPVAGDDRTPGQRRADALVDVCRLALRTGELPEHGGEPPQVAVTIRFDTLTRQLRGAVLDNGERLSAATARRMACDARIVPVVLGGAGQVLDAGRSRRLATGALRRALVARDRGCAHPNCDRPPRFCDGHHLRAWSQGGSTCLANMVLVCRRHHHLLHDPAQGWQVRLGHDGLPEFIPPPWIDLMQRPQRNLYHPRS